MRFTLKPAPKLHEHRTVKRFAWLPLRISDQLVWLESYWQRQKCYSDRFGRLYWSSYAEYLNEELRGGD